MTAVGGGRRHSRAARPERTRDRRKRSSDSTESDAAVSRTPGALVHAMPATMTAAASAFAPRLRATSPRMESTRRGSLRVVDAAAPSAVEDETGELLEIVPLGAGSEVGRSCVIAKFKGKTLPKKIGKFKPIKWRKVDDGSTAS